MTVGLTMTTEVEERRGPGTVKWSQFAVFRHTTHHK